MARALLIVDVQNDFTPGGALGVDRGDDVIAPLNALAASGDVDLVVATRDWHPPDHGSFVEQGGVWPVHCVAGTLGAELHPSVDADHVDLVIDKGTDRDTEGYSGFDGTHLAAVLREHDVDHVLIGGLATDYCVRATALDALREGFAVDVLADATRPVEREPGDGAQALDDVRAAGGNVT